MKILIHAAFEVNNTLKELIEKKVNKLSKFHDRISKADVFLKIDDPKAPKGKVVEITIYVPGKDAFAKETSDSFEKAIAATATKLERQLKKQKEKLSGK